MTDAPKRTVSGLPAPPQDPAQIAEFPRAVSTPKRYRAHDSANGPWWFASAPANPDDGGRFDLKVNDGTCYVASDINTAVLERLGPRAGGFNWIPDSERLRATAVAELDPGDWSGAGDLADVTHSYAAVWCTREISTVLDYALTQSWAALFRRAGHAGVRYQSRLTTGPSIAEAWFGPGGAPSTTPPFVPVPDWRADVPVVKVVRESRAEIID